MELFRPLEEELKDSCTKIRIAHYNYGVEAALVAKRALLNVQKTLRDVQLIRIVHNLPVDEAVEVVSIFSSALEGCTLRSLTLDIGESGEKGVRALAPLLKSQKTLEKLGFDSHSLSEGAARAICELFPSLETIKGLHFNRMFAEPVEDDAGRIVSKLVEKCIALKNFNFSIRWIGIDGAVALAEALGKGSSLKMLCLQNSKFRKAGGVALSKAINGHVALAEVDLSRMNLEDKGMIALARSLGDTAPSLSVLRVGGNYITRKAAPALAECVAVKNCLTIFSAKYSELEDDGTILICQAISEGHEQLKELNLSFNKMTKIGAKVAAEAVANKPNFCRLSIYANYISAKRVEAVKDVLRKGAKGESVLRRKLYQYKRSCGRIVGDILMETCSED